jgi:pimeloyl-ACP methyl ester carboxylesterase
MESYRIGAVDLHYVEHGSGAPVIVLHGAGVDHREPEACFEPVFERDGRHRRIYPDLPGMGQTVAPETVSSAEDVLDVLLGLLDQVTRDGPALVVGHSAGAYFGRAMAARRPSQLAGLALICPLLPETHDVPPHRPVIGSDLGDEQFRSYFVVQTPEMLERHQRYVAPAAALADHQALARIGERWELPPERGPAFAGPTLLVAGLQDSTVGYAASVDLLDRYPAATLAVLDAAGHALPHEQPALLAALVLAWLARCGDAGGG